MEVVFARASNAGPAREVIVSALIIPELGYFIGPGRSEVSVPGGPLVLRDLGEKDVLSNIDDRSVPNIDSLVASSNSGCDVADEATFEVLQRIVTRPTSQEFDPVLGVGGEVIIPGKVPDGVTSLGGEGPVVVMGSHKEVPLGSGGPGPDTSLAVPWLGALRGNGINNETSPSLVSRGEGGEGQEEEKDEELHGDKSCETKCVGGVVGRRGPTGIRAGSEHK